MDQQTLLTVMTGFVIVSAVALLIQAAFLFGMYKAVRTMQQNAQPLIQKVEAMVPKVEALVPKVEGILDSSKVVIDDSRRQIQELTSKTSDILDTTKKQLVRVDAVLEDASSRARIQMDRAEAVLDDAMNRTQKTVALVNGGIVKPIREIQGVAAGIRMALTFLTKGRPNPTEATADEEMFI